MSKQEVNSIEKQDRKSGSDPKEAQAEKQKPPFLSDKGSRTLVICLVALILIVGGVLLYRNAYLLPHRAEAEEQIFPAEQLFERDSFQTALQGNGADIKGFLEIIDRYGGTPSGNLARAYAGVCYYRLGDYESAIEQLDKFKSSDIMLRPSLLGLIGDCYVETDRFDSAVGYFEEAATKADNILLSPIYLIKAGLAYEALGETDKAKEAYIRVKEQYPASPSVTTAEKYLATLTLQGK